MRKAICLILFQTLSFASSGARSQEAPPIPELPRLGPNNFSLPIREQIQEAYAGARAHPSDAEANGRLGMVLQTYGLFREAAVSYQRASRLAPSIFRWTYYLGVAEASAGHCNGAVDAFRLALGINSQYVPARLGLANCLLASANWDESSKLYAAIVKQHPDNADAFYGLGRVRAARHDAPSAADAYRQACELFPNFGAAHYALALTYRTLGSPDRAEEQLRLYEQNKDSAPAMGDPLLAEVRALNRSATYQVQIGMELEKQGRLEDSAAAHEKALQIDPQMVQARINLIELYGRLGHFDKAEEQYRTAVHLAPGSTESYYNYGVLLLSAGKYQQAEEAFRKTVELNPFYAGAHNNLGYLLERQGKVSDAATEYRTAVDNKPSDRQARFNLGRVLVNQRKYQEGIKELEKTIQPEDENTPRYMYALGAAFARSGDLQSALHYIRQARDGAVARGQSELVASIERDLRTLELTRNPQ